MRWALGVLASWLLLGATPAFADSITVYDEGRWSGYPFTQPRTIVADTASGDSVKAVMRDGNLQVTATTHDVFEGAMAEFAGRGVTGELAVGSYPDAQDSWARQADHPGIHVQTGYSYEQC